MLRCTPPKGSRAVAQNQKQQHQEEGVRGIRRSSMEPSSSSFNSSVNSSSTRIRRLDSLTLRCRSFPAQLPLVLGATGEEGACTLQELGPEDKQKVAKLLKQVVDLGQEVQQLKQQRDEQAKEVTQHQQDLQENNRQLHKEHHALKKKLGQVLLVLRASQAKVNALEAAAQQGQQGAARAQAHEDPSDALQERQPVAPPDCAAGASLARTDSARASDPAAGAGAAAAAAGPPTSGASAARAAAVPSPEARASRAHTASQSMGPLLHVASGSRVSITINHMQEHAPSAPQPAAPAHHTPTKATATQRAAAPLGAARQGPSLPGTPHGSPKPGTGRGADGIGSTGLPPADLSPVRGYHPAAAAIAIPTTTAAAALPVPYGPRSILVDATMQQYEDLPVHEVRAPRLRNAGVGGARVGAPGQGDFGGSIWSSKTSRARTLASRRFAWFSCSCAAASWATW
ncbi:hypothetical protein TSOC_003782 [Tetrabaena socialis]|uniref:Uncharacterized protein n=1 Tax=Tetrabaena socialis TaxID=47790 RepID=A0A2J8AAJ5_9CHLO|nr:hypothetical protein TSOC_003782 [Tetrabaena socialis]|eukprot:PNH09541.1 hypothetical protein TSOC_003782 [Tetrabaena socialis]